MFIDVLIAGHNSLLVEEGGGAGVRGSGAAKRGRSREPLTVVEVRFARAWDGIQQPWREELLTTLRTFAFWDEAPEFKDNVE